MTATMPAKPAAATTYDELLDEQGFDPAVLTDFTMKGVKDRSVSEDSKRGKKIVSRLAANG